MTVIIRLAASGRNTMLNLNNGGSKRYPSWRCKDCHNAVKRIESAGREDPTGEKAKSCRKMKRDPGAREGHDATEGCQELLGEDDGIQQCGHADWCGDA